MGRPAKALRVLASKAFRAQRSPPPAWRHEDDLLELPQPPPMGSFRKALTQLGAHTTRATRQLAACLPGGTASSEEEDFQGHDFSGYLDTFLDDEVPAPPLSTSSRHVNNPLPARLLNKMLSYTITPARPSSSAAPLLQGAAASSAAASPTPSPADHLAYIRPAAGYYSPVMPLSAPTPFCSSAAPTSSDDAWWSDSNGAGTAAEAHVAAWDALPTPQSPPAAAAPASAFALLIWQCVQPGTRCCSAPASSSMSTASSWESGSSASALAWAAPSSWSPVVRPDPRYSSSEGSSDASAASCDAYSGGSTSGEDERDERDVGRGDQGLLLLRGRRGGRAGGQGKVSLLSLQFWRARCAEVRSDIQRASRRLRC